MCLCPTPISYQYKPLPGRLMASNLIGRYEANPLLYQYVPCGKCEECTKTRQDHHAYKLYQRIRNLSCCYHLTLTYAPEHLPFAQSYNYIDHESGEVFRISSPELLPEDDNLNSLRGWYSEQLKSSRPVYYYSQPYKLFEDSIEAVITPSLKRSDVRSALKVCRITYERRYGRKAPDFVYSFCGEYGPTRCRPHYHMVIASKDDIDTFVIQFCAYWESHYGYYVRKKVNRINDNNTDGYELVAKYLSKYVSKGDFECDSVVSGYAEKGRVCQSRGLDPRLHEEVFETEIIPYYRAYDLFGPYDPLSMRLQSSGALLSHSQLDILCDEIIKRSYVSLGLSKMSMPRYLKEAIFSYKLINGKLCPSVYQLSDDEKILRKKYPESFSQRLIRSTLSYLVQYRLQMQILDRDAQRAENSKSRGAACAISALKSSLEHRAQRLNKAYKDFLCKSVQSQ